MSYANYELHDEAREVAILNKARADAAEQVQQPMDDDTVRSFLGNEGLEASPEAPMENKERAPAIAPIRLTGVDLQKVSGESDYETWKAAFMTVVDRLNMLVTEKMLRLQSCLSGKASIMVHDLGYS